MAYIKGLVFSFIWLVLFCFLAHMMIRHFHQIAKSTDPLDDERNDIKEMLKGIPSGTPLAFITNIRDTGDASWIYYQTQFGCCPHILSDQSSEDHILYYRSTFAMDTDIRAIHDCDTICQRPGQNYTLFLLRKNKKK